MVSESATQYVVSLRAFNNYGKGPVVYDLIYTREIDGEYSKMPHFLRLRGKNAAYMYTLKKMK